jgi:aspartyl-tRNA(Asn)/glutamyl-tRNA(Gln) amidotransferase subunit A
VGLLREQAAAISAGERSSEELVAAALKAAESLQPVLNAFTMLFADEALVVARAVDAERRPSRPDEPLRGVPVAVKDLYDIAGAVTSGCCRAYMSRRPARADAPAVEALRRAGAIVIGKTNMHELAFGATNTVSSYGRANNPWDPERMTGGSSGGSAAAVGARIVALALGSDTGGSIRIPSSFCGTSGLKTTGGLLPLDGVLPMSPSLDTVGPIAGDAEDLALAFWVLGGDSIALRDAAPHEGVRRIGLASDSLFSQVNPEVGAAVREAAEVIAHAAGADLVECATPWFEDAQHAWLDIALAEFAREHAPLIERSDDIDPTTCVILSAGSAITPEREAEARARAGAARARFTEDMRSLDAIVLPATPFTAPRHGDQSVAAGSIELPVHLGGPSSFTQAVSAIGAPAIAIPCGFSEAGLPVGLQLVGPHGADRKLLGLAALYQLQTGWHVRRPELAG